MVDMSIIQRSFVCIQRYEDVNSSCADVLFVELRRREIGCCGSCGSGGWRY